MVSLQGAPLSASLSGNLLMWLWLVELRLFLLVSSASSMLWPASCTLAYQWLVTGVGGANLYHCRFANLRNGLRGHTNLLF
jgi:hypothetical protein